MKPIRTDVPRDQLIESVREFVPVVDGSHDASPDFIGGVAEAKRRLDSLDAVAYGRTRNHLDGAVSRLSPFIRHSVLTLADIRDHILAKHKASSVFKFIQELAWRDYYQRVWHAIGPRIWDDLEPYKTGISSRDYADELPADLVNADTGIDYVDQFVSELHQTGYLHNHARMWLAAYVVHGRRVRWQAGARWFLSHLLDGDEASNNLSWQWCASTFAHKPYIFNRENVIKYSGDRFTRHQQDDPFDDSYENIVTKLFDKASADADFVPPVNSFRADAQLSADDSPPRSPAIVWIHDGMLSRNHPAFTVDSNSPAVFVVDEQLIRDGRHSLQRIVFQLECAADLECEVVRSESSSLVETVAAAARKHGANAIITGRSPEPRIRSAIKTLRDQFEVCVVDRPAFVELEGTVDLRRFSRYWAKAERLLI